MDAVRGVHVCCANRCGHHVAHEMLEVSTTNMGLGDVTPNRTLIKFSGRIGQTIMVLSPTAAPLAARLPA